MVQGGATSERYGSTGPGSTSTSLLCRLQAQDPEALASRQNSMGRWFTNLCRRFGLNPADAADVFQETFSAVSVSVGRFQKDQTQGRFRGWLWTITRNKIHDHYRSQAGREAAIGGTAAQRNLAELPAQLAEPPTDTEDLAATGQPVPTGPGNGPRRVRRRTWDAFGESWSGSTRPARSRPTWASRPTPCIRRNRACCAASRGARRCDRVRAIE